MNQEVFAVILFLIFFGWIPVFTIVFAIKLIVSYIVESKIRLRDK